MTTKNLFNLVGRKSYEQTRKSRHALESVVSRLSLGSLICVLMLTLGVGNVWGAENDSHDFSQTLQQVLNDGVNIDDVTVAEQTYTVKKVIVTVNYNKSRPGATVSVKVGGTTFGSAQTINSSTTTTFEYEGASAIKGQVVVSSVNNCTTSSGNGTFKITNVRLIEGPAAVATPYTVTFYKTDGSTDPKTEESAGAGVTPPTMQATCGDWTFQGWSTSYSNSTTSTTVLSTVTLTAGKYYPSGATTLYPVYTKNGTIESEVSDEITQSTTGLATTGSTGYTAWSNKTVTSDAVYAGQSNKGVSFLQLRNNNPSGIISTTSGGILKKVVVTWKTTNNPANTNGRYVTIFGKNSSYTSGCADLYDNNQKGSSLGTIVFGTSTELDDLNEDDDYEYVGILASAAVYINKITITWLVEEDATFYYSYPTCCTALATINGSISLTNAECNPGELKATWKMSATTGIASQTLKVYKSSDDSEVTGSKITGISASTSNQTQTITGLNPCETYYVKVENVSMGSSYCEGGVIATSSTATTLGYTLTVTKSNCSISSGSEPSRICSNVSVTYAASTGYALPTSITVTNAGAQNTGWTWNSGTGVLTINKANVTGNVTVTITPTCVSPVIGTDPADADYYVGDSPDALSVSATLASGTLTYLWKVSTNGGSTWSDAEGTNNTASYSGASLSASSAGTTKFKCIVGNSQGGCTVESAVATITVTTASYFVNGETVFIQAGKSGSAWDASACVKAWFNASGEGGSAQTTYWLFDVTAEGDDKGKKLFAAVVPATGDLNQVTLQRFADGCGDFYNNNGTLTKASSGGSNTFRTENSGNSGVAWNLSGVTMNLMSSDDWLTPVASVTDQGAGVWSGTYEYTPSNTSTEYVIATNYNGNIGNTGSNNNATLSDMKVGSTYNVSATLNVTTHALTMSKTFVKGEVSFDLQGHGEAISKLTNVTAGSKISAPSPAPSATGYTFGGWYKDAECTDDWDFANDVVNETMTLYAKWTANVYTITKTLTNVTNSSLPSSFTYTGSTTTALNSSFSVDATNFFLPSSITVTMGGSPLTKDTHYTYNNTTGAFTFTAVITGNIVITASATAKLKSIAITAQPTTRAYLVGETFSKTGAVVTATMGDGTTKAVTASATWDLTTLSAGTSQTVTASYTEAGITKTATTTIDVYSVTVQKYDETPAEIVDAGVTVGANGRTLSQSVGSTKYVFNNWSLITASGMSISTNSLTGTPTGNVVVRGNFYKPVVITWLKGGQTYSAGTPTTLIAYGSQWKDLALPEAPADNSLGACADKFMGWSNTMAVEWVKEDTHTAPATLFTSVTGNTTVINAPITFRAVFASAEEGDNFELVTSLSGIKEGDAYMGSYISYSGTRYYAGTSNSAMTSVTVSGTPLALSSTTGLKKVSIVATGNTNQYYIKDGTKFLYANSAGSAPTFSDNTCAWTFSGPDGNKLFTVLSSLGTYYLRAYASSTSAGQFKMYGNTTNSGICLFQKGVAYSDYVTVCCAQYDITLASSGSVTGGTFTASPTSACEDAEVTLSATPADGYSFAGWTVTKTASPYTDITSTNVDGNTLTMPDYGVTVNASFATLTGIVVKTAPTKTTYCEGDNFDPTGLVITASFSNSTTLDIPYSGNEAKFTFSPNLSTGLTTGNTSVSISYGGQSTSQAITVNALRTISLTSSGSVTGGTFTADNASACVGATITIEAEAASHYTFGSWAITKTSDGTDVTGSVSIGSASTASTSFTMPDYNVTVTPTFSENAFRTVVFKNNGQNLYSGEGYDATNNWKQKVYVGEAPVTPTALTDGYGSGDACNATSTLFYGWTKNTWGDYIADEATVKARTEGNKVYKKGATLATVAAGDGDANGVITYHAVWAAGDGAPSISTPLLAMWDKQTLAASTAVYAKDKDGNTLNGAEGKATVSLTSNIALGNTTNYYCAYNSNISSYPEITISGLNFSSYDAGVITFFARASTSNAYLSASYSINNGVSYSDLDWDEGGTAKMEYSYLLSVPKTTTNVKITYSSNSGNFYFGTVRAYGDNTSDTYDFTELTSSNTSGWSGDEWDGYYLIVGKSKATALRSDAMEGLYGLTDVTPSEEVITTADLGLIFKATYNSSTTKYAIQSVATLDYLTDNAGGYGERPFHLLEPSSSEYYEGNVSIAYNDITNATGYHIQWNSDRMGSYTSSTAPTLYKILSSYSTFRTTCCEKMAVTKGGSPAGTVTGGTFTVDKETACEGEEVAVSVTSTTTGYNFDHWQVLQTASPFTDYSSNVSEGVLTMPSVPVTVTAVFAAAHTTTVELDAQSGTGGTNSVTATVNLPMPAADMPTRAGYEFGGYYAAPNGSGTQYYAADGSSAHVWDDGESATSTLYAKWTASGYTVTLNKEGATTQGTASVSVSFGANTNLTTAITCPTYTNKVFGGYWTTASGEGTQLIDGDGNWLPSVTSYTDVNRNWLYANDLELHARWTNVSYTNYRTTCGPEIEVTGGPVYLTSYAGCEVLTIGNITVSSDDWGSTVGAEKFLRFKMKDMVGGTTYAFTSSNNTSSEFRVYNAAGNGGSYADGGYITIPTGTTNASYDFRIAYTPAAGVYNTLDHYTLIVELMDNSATKKTLTMETVELYGRTLPEQFVIAAKKDGVWKALPNDLAGTEAAAKAIPAVEIIVDNETTPTSALYAPENTLYKATGYYTGPNVADRNRSGVRFTRTGAQYLQVSSVPETNLMWLSSTGGTNVQDWYLNSSDFSSYSVKIDPRAGTMGYLAKQMGIYGNNFGFYTSLTEGAGDIYFLPVEHIVSENNAVEWGKHSIVVEAAASSYSKVIARVGDVATKPLSFTQTKTSGGNNSKYTWTINFGNAIDLTSKTGQKLFLDWLNSDNDVAAVGMIAIPRIIDGAATMSNITTTKVDWTRHDVVVLPGATLTADAGSFSESKVTIRNIEVYPGATLKISSGELTTTTLTLRNGWSRAGEKRFDVARVYIPNTGSLKHTTANLDWYIDYDQYYPMAVPFPVTTSKIRYANTNTDPSVGTNIVIKDYDGEQRANTVQSKIGQNWKPVSPETLNPGKGYAITAKRPNGKAFAIVRMPMTFTDNWTTNGEQANVSTDYKNKVTITAYPSAAWYAMGWNFIANPYMSVFNGSDDGLTGKLEVQNGTTIKYATIPNLEFTDYDQKPIAGADLKPASGFFVQANTTGEVEFVATGQKEKESLQARQYAVLDKDNEAYIELNGPNGKDMMGIIVGTDYTEIYEPNADLAKVLGESNSVKTYMQYGGMDMAYVAINEALAKNWIPVTVQIPENGEYTFSLNNISCVEQLEGVYLIDYGNNDKVTNLIDETYSFTAIAGTISNRFAINAIVGERDVPSAVDAVSGGVIDSDKPIKFLYHENVYILYHGVIYDATGKKVSEINK